MISRWQQYKEKNGTTPLDMLNPKTKRVDVKIKNDRLSICFSCPDLIKLTNQCKKCGCFMDFKTSLEASKCPVGKW
jgi:hypothetical protein